MPRRNKQNINKVKSEEADNQKNSNVTNEKDESINKEPITINDPSFNIRHQPSQISNIENDDSNPTTLKEKIAYTSNLITDNFSFRMETLIKQALCSLQNFINPNLGIEQQIPFQILNECNGIMFLNVIKGSIGFGGMLGTGIIMARNPNWRTEWSPPCAIVLGGLQLGFNIGIEKTDSIIIIRDANVINKFHSGLRLGGDMSLAVGPLGRDINIGLTVNEKGIIPNISYSVSKGMYVGFALEGCVVTIRNDCNEQFYGQKIDVSHLLNGSIQVPFNNDYITLCKTLSNYMKKNSEMTNITNNAFNHVSNNNQFSQPWYEKDNNINQFDRQNQEQQQQQQQQRVQQTQNIIVNDENHPILNITSTPKNVY